MRAFRPSQFVRQDDVDDEAELVKQAHLEQYRVRAKAGLPLFDASTLDHLDSAVSRNMLAHS